MSSDAVEKIKARLNIVEVVESYVKLQKAGKYYKARCPFHNEKTPSFTVSLDRGSYYCFGCSKTGDIFTFVQEIEGVDFRSALKILADRAGVELKKENVQERSERDAIYAALETATRFFESQLPKQEKVIAYLKKRGMTGETAKKFRIGYALEEWSALYDHLLSKGFSASIMDKAGLIVKKDAGGYYDRFRGRIMFPIADNTGCIVAFSGRVFYVSGASEEKTAKYVNSPETAIFNKSEILYGFDKAKQAIRKADACIFVEGQMDLVMSHQAGIEHTVAVSGTALTAHHLGLVKRLTENLIFAFDADDAGVSAAGRSINLALQEGFEARVVAVPSGKDPADSILEDPERWKQAVAEAKHVIDYYLDYAVAKGLDDRALQNVVKERVLPYIAQLSHALDQGRFVSKTAAVLHMSEQPVWDELKKVQQEMQKNQVLEKPSEVSTWGRNWSRKDIVGHRIIGIVLWQKGLQEPEVETESIVEALENMGGHMPVDMVSDDRERYIFEAESYCSSDGSVQVRVDELLANFKREMLRERSVKLRKELALSKGDDVEQEIMKQIQETQKEIDSIDRQIKET
jgi:DNA primase